MANHQTPAVRRAQILKAAQACFSRTGFHKTKMDDIVEASGLSKGALYWHFKGKDEIFLALFDQFDREIFSAWDDLSEADALETLRIESEIVLSALLGDRSLVEMWNEFLKHPLARERFAVLYEHSRARLGATIENGIARGEITACDAQHAAAMLTAVIEGLLLQALTDASFNPLDAWPTTWKILSRGMTPNE
ncbi:MAG: TetR/AcrR family transcriptional regulator [Myxococcota bacterium]